MEVFKKEIANFNYHYYINPNDFDPQQVIKNLISKYQTYKSLVYVE